MIGSPTKFTTSIKRSHHFGTSPSTNKDTATTQPVIEAIHILQKIFSACCGEIGHRADAWIFRGPNLLPPSIKIKMKQSNTINGDEPTKPPREWNSQTSESHFKSRTSPTKNSCLVSDIMGRCNQHAIYDSNIEVNPSKFPFESNY